MSWLTESPWKKNAAPDMMDIDIDIDIASYAAYQPLPTGYIRLAILDSNINGAFDAEVSVRLEVVQLRSDSCYDAISYVWGDSKDTVDIICNQRPMKVTTSLCWALRRASYRWSQPQRRIWADAICIDQSNNAERSVQVGLMGEIYYRASQVLICIPCAEAETLTANGGDMVTAHEEEAGTRRLQQVVTDFNTTYPKDRFPDTFQIPELSLQQSTSADLWWTPLTTFMSSSWFTRAWVVQEVGLAREPRILYGRQAEFKYRDLIHLVSFLRHQTRSAVYPIPSRLIHNTWGDWRETWASSTPHSLTFFDLLSHGAMLSCSDPRDHVYAFLGHPLLRCDATDHGKAAVQSSPAIVPDYTKSPSQVFREVSIHFLEKEGIRVLTCVEHTENTIIDTTPSWVVRWDTVVVLNDISTSPYAVYRTTTPRKQPTITQQSFADDHLLVPGTQIDFVTHTFEAITIHDLFVRGCSPDTLMVISEQIATLKCIYGTHREVMQSVIMHTLLVGLFSPDVNPANATGRVGPFFESIAKSRPHCVNRLLVITRKGYYGLAPLITKPGDVCVAVIGVDVPLTMRPTYRVDNEFRLLGEMYLHGMMMGQVDDMLASGSLREETISII